MLYVYEMIMEMTLSANISSIHVKASFVSLENVCTVIFNVLFVFSLCHLTYWRLLQKSDAILRESLIF